MLVVVGGWILLMRVRTLRTERRAARAWLAALVAHHGMWSSAYAIPPSVFCRL